jgi:lysophospholipase L1-like esterase
MDGTMIEKRDRYADLIVYGGTSAGVMAAVQASVMGKDVVVIEPTGHLGGLTSGGLGNTDAGIQHAIGGRAREFYERIGRKYGKSGPVWQFEPGVALEVFRDLVSENEISVVYHERLERTSGDGVTMHGGRIREIRMESGNTYRGEVFVDATYEGDLMALAGVSCFVGREGNDRYGETQNGVRPRDENELPDGIDPYVEAGNPASGLLPRVNPDAGGNPGDADTKLQAYCYRMCLTDRPENRMMIEKPDGYDERDYELLIRALDAGMPPSRVFKLSPVGGGKTDSNNHSGISTDYNGGNHHYPEADYATREAIARRHEVYQKGLVWTVQNHPRVPEQVRLFYAPWGLPLDEFVENGHWSPQLYVRESRRMVSDVVVTEHVVLGREEVDDPIGLGSYAADSHHTQYYVHDRGYVSTEGGFYNRLKEPYPISYKAIVPRRGECVNLLVPVCVSATHAAYGSIRMEPVFMILGQSAAIAASLCIDSNCDVQDLDYRLLRAELDRCGQLLTYHGEPGESASITDEIVVENLGAGGQNTSEARSAFISMLASHPEHLVIFYGMNDAMNPGKLVPLPLFRENLRAMVHQAREDGVENIFLLGIHPVNTEYLAERHPTHPEIARLQEHLADYDAAVQQVAADTGSIFVDWRRRFLSESAGESVEEATANHTDSLLRCEANSSARDGNHLTALGYQALADEVLQALRDVVNPGDRVTCMGDSLTYGAHMAGAGTATGETYPAVLYELLNRGQE